MNLCVSLSHNLRIQGTLHSVDTPSTAFVDSPTFCFPSIVARRRLLKKKTPARANNLLCHNGVLTYSLLQTQAI